MPQIINTNIASLNAQRNLNKSQSANQTSLQRLSSGLRINSAKDDAAGLAISTRFNSQIRGLNVAVRNAGDGISLAQTAEGALGSMNDNLQRVRELAVQSANATNSDVDRDALQAEVSQLLAEVSRTAEETDFNGRKLLDGSFEATFQIGANSGQTLDISIAELTADKLGVGTSSGVSAQGDAAALQNGDLIINGVAIDPSTAESDSYSTVDASSSAIAKVDAINAKSDQTGVSAVVNTNVSSGAEMTAALGSGSIELNGVTIAVSTGGLDAAADRNSVVESINAKSGQTGVVAVDDGDAGGVRLEAENGRNIELTLNSEGTGNLTSAATGLSEGVSYGGYTLVSEDSSEIKIEGGQGTGTGDISNAGLTAGTYSGREASLTSTSTFSALATSETQGTFTTADMNIVATTVNATNNSFEVSIDGGAFVTLTLDSTFDAGAAGGAGQYDDATQLAAAINHAITDSDLTTNPQYTANAAFRDADTGAALVTASDSGNGGITLTSTTQGSDSSVVARTGDGNMSLATDTVEATGTAADTAQRLSVDFVFDGKNNFTADNNLVLVTTGGPAATSTINVVAATDYTAESFAALVNGNLGANAGAIQATVADDGVTVNITSVAGSGVTGLADTGTNVTSTALQNTVQHLANDDVVITDVNGFLAGVTGADETFGISVDGSAAADVNLGSAAADVTAYNAASVASGTGSGVYATDLAAAKAGGGNAEDTAIFLNNVFLAQVAGGGVTATAVGDQVVISSDAVSGGTVELTTGVANPIDAAAATGTTGSTVAIAATAGTAISTGFNTADGTGDDAAGTFMSSDPDGTGTAFEAQAAPLEISAATGNNTFDIAVDGAATPTTITIADGSYSTMDELAAAITAGTTASVATLEGPDISGIDSGAYDFANDGNLTFSVALAGGTAQAITIDDDIASFASVGAAVGAPAKDAAAQQELVGVIQTELDTTFGANQVTVGFNATSGKLEFNAANGTDSLAISNSVITGGSGTDPFTADGDNIPSFTVAASSDKQSLVFTSGSSSATSAVDITNGTFAIEGGAVDGSLVTGGGAPNVLETGDLLINGSAIRGADAKDDNASDTTAISSDAAGSGIAVAAAINGSTDATGVTATVNATMMNGGGDNTGLAKADVGSTGSITINGVETAGMSITGDEGRDRQTAIELINAKSGQTGVEATDNGESITLTAADGRNISVAIDNDLAANAAAGRDSSNFGNTIGLSAAENGVGEGDLTATGSTTYSNTAATTYSTVSLTSASSIEVASGVNGADELAFLGLQAGTYGGGEDGQFLKDMDISTFEGATAALTAIDNAIGAIASQRADLGAIQNRMESTVSNLAITSENLSAANSRIQDADFAAETAELSRTQVLQQAGISILSQANQGPQQVLSLLG